MKSFLLKVLLLGHLFLLPGIAFSASDPVGPTAIETTLGTVELPLQSEINEAIARTKADGNLSDEARSKSLEQLNYAQTLFSRLERAKSDLKKLNADISNAQKTLKKLSTTYNQTKKNFTNTPNISKLNAQQLEKLLEETKSAAAEVRNDLTNTNAEYTSLQTLPERAQGIISKANEQIKSLLQDLAATADLNSLDSKIKALTIETLRQENELLQSQMNAQITLLDFADYALKIDTIKDNYYTKLIQDIQNRQNTMLSDALLDHGSSPAADLKLGEQALTNEVKKELKKNNDLAKFLNEQIQKNLKLTHDAQSLDTAFAQIKQIDKSISAQIEGLGDSLLLSRLLNRHQNELPKIKLDYNFDNAVPDLNIWLYELRNLKDKLFDLETYVQSLVEKTPALAGHEDELMEIAAKRKELLNMLNREVSTELTQAINIKLRYEEFKQLKKNVQDKITENIFWLKSNQPLGAEFFTILLPSIKFEFTNFMDRLKKDSYWQESAKTFLFLLLPAILIGLLIRLTLQQKLVRADNNLARRLDHKDDNLLITPLALFFKLIYVLPNAILWLLVGSVLICLSLPNTKEQTHVIAMLGMHILFFVFILDILKPNSLAQRHFCFNPDRMAQNRMLLNKIWYSLIPILTVANITEIDSTGIFYDVIGYIIIFISSIVMVITAIIWIKNQLKSGESLNMLLWFTAGACVLSPLLIAVMVGTGYYYTTVKLINRFAFTAYIGLFYWIISNILKRSMYVWGNLLLERHTNTLRTAKKQEGFEGRKKGAYADILRVEFFGTKAFKLIDALLIITTLFLMYLLWNDLAGVLSYLKTIHLWTESNLVNGQEVIVSALTLADVLLAVLILVITGVLTKNLPSVFERMLLLRKGNKLRSTSYTVKIISSYIITALGIILAAGAVGISWNNLQWLVAALSVGLGFGLQEIFANFVSGLIILLERQIRVGDIITLGDLSGTVNKIRIRSTTIISFDNKEVMIPNKQFITSALTNWSLSNTVTKIEFNVGVAYGTNTDLAKGVLRSIVTRCPYLHKSMAPLVYIVSLDESCISLRCEVYVSEIGKRKLTYDYISSETLKQFAQKGIEIPFNQLDINFKNLEFNKEVINSIREKFSASLKNNELS